MAAHVQRQCCSARAQDGGQGSRDGPSREVAHFWMARARALRKTSVVMTLELSPSNLHPNHRMGSSAKVDSKDEHEETCVICLSPITERAVLVPCNHLSFDFVCIVSWLQERTTCPLCKTKASAVQYDWQSSTEFKTYNVLDHHSQNQAPSCETSIASLSAPYGLPRRPRSTRRPYSPPVEDLALGRRREIYQRRMYSLHVGSNPFSGYRDVTPRMFAGSADLERKARAWIRRELRVFRFLYSNTSETASNETTSISRAEFMLSYIISILKMVDTKSSSGHAEDLLTEFLGRENSRQFLHELNSFLRSPYTKPEQWDMHVQYREDLC